MKKLIAYAMCFACVAMLTLGISALADNSKEPEDLGPQINNVEYLTEEDVFAAIAATTGDAKLKENITSKQSAAPNGFVIEGFHAADYSAYTNGQYGGMYLNAEGELVICYVEGSTVSADVRNGIEANASLLINESKDAVVARVVTESVKYSYHDIMSAYDKLNTVATKIVSGINRFWVDIENNRIVVEVVDDDEGYNAEDAFLEVVDSDLLVFIRTKNATEIIDVATINGTSQINNGLGSGSTPAGRMYSSRLGGWGVITCGHEYSNGGSVYYGSVATVKIGTILGHVISATNDASFIVLDSGHSYTASLYDELSSSVPVVNSTITLRGHYSGTQSAKVTSTNASYWGGGILRTGHIEVNKGVQAGDSGGGAIGGVIDGGRTNLIVGINRSVTTDGTTTFLVKGGVIYNAFD